MNPGPEFFRFGGINSRKNAVSLIEDVCSECGSSSLRKRMEAGANELLTGKREGLVPGARVLIINSAMFWNGQSPRTDGVDCAGRSR